MPGRCSCLGSALTACARLPIEIQLTANGETVWHSGKVQSAAVHADAPTVGGSRVRGCWRVRLWDENDTPGAWSEAHFETGLAQSDWQGEWVDPETEEIDIPGDDAINAFARPNWERKQAEKEAAGKGATEPYKPHRPALYLRKTFTAPKGRGAAVDYRQGAVCGMAERCACLGIWFLSPRQLYRQQAYCGTNIRCNAIFA